MTFRRTMQAWAGDPAAETEQVNIPVERYCHCGEKLVTKARDEDDAREKVNAFLREHIGRDSDGTEHYLMKRGHYWQMIRRLREEEKRSVEAQARKILEEGRLAPNTRRYALKRQ
jgi:hypothetical protein